MLLNAIYLYFSNSSCFTKISSFMLKDALTVLNAKKKKRKQQQQQILKKSAGYICKFPQTSKKSNCIYWQTWRCSCLRKYRVKVTDWYKFISATYLLIKTSKLTMRYGNQAMQISHVINPLLCNAVKWSETLYDIAK